jgi:2-polyprenyl-3-methyl-5-hydroxy-6-metoxy-1,4-benzoquinol methylase
MRSPVLSVGRRVRLRHVRVAVERVLRDGASVLDAGCSDALLAGAIAESHPSSAVLGIDVDGKALAFARARAARLPNLEVRRHAIGGDALGRRFDLVVCTDVLEHLADDRAAAAWLAEAVAPGGHLVLHVPASPQRHALAPVARAMEKELAGRKGPHVREGYDPDDIARLVEAAGLDVDRLEWTFHNALTRSAADVDTWTYLRRARAVKLVLLPALLAAAEMERAPSTSRAGNGLLVVARA